MLARNAGKKQWLLCADPPLCLCTIDDLTPEWLSHLCSILSWRTNLFWNLSIDSFHCLANDRFCFTNGKCPFRVVCSWLKGEPPGTRTLAAGRQKNRRWTVRDLELLSCDHTVKWRIVELDMRYSVGNLWTYSELARTDISPSWVFARQRDGPRLRMLPTLINLAFNFQISIFTWMHLAMKTS